MYKVYWTDPLDEPCAQNFEDMSEALQHAEFLRSSGRRFVTMVSENPDSVGKPGVDSVKHGLLPDGELYTWRKRR